MMSAMRKVAMKGLPALEKRLEDLGYRVIQRSKEVETNDNEFLEGSIKA